MFSLSLSDLPSTDHPILDKAIAGIIAAGVWFLIKNGGEILLPTLESLPSTGSPLQDGLFVFLSVFVVILLISFVAGNGETNDDQEATETEDVEIEVIPQHFEDGQSDDIGVSEDCVRIFNQVGEMRVVVTWPDEITREWVEIDAGPRLEFVFQDQPPDVDFDGSMFKLDRSCTLGPFDVKIHPQEQINQRTLRFKGRNSDQVFKTTELRRAN